ncbi:hypothetical protein LTR08_003884 [Meristemomyces frigidus]|nr:hypothetical protein LTR08_003884 [Meristemomyces frigidus]
MESLNVTFGIELEFLCVYPSGCFANCSPESGSDENEEFLQAGPAIFHALRQSGISATGYDAPDDDVVMDDIPHSSWRVEDDVCDLSQREHDVKPHGYEVENVELSSRKFDFFRDDWRSEIQTVLDVLFALEVNSQGCRFVANDSTGFHVHIGNGHEKIPLRTAKNVFQIATAFERCFDLLHAAPRIQCPVSDTQLFLFAPPCYFHANNGLNVQEAGLNKPMLFNWLASIEQVGTYQDLGILFRTGHSIYFDDADDQTNGHNSAYNFDNLFTSWARDEEDLTKTIEFRQHGGTLDYLTIVSWILLTTQLVQYAHIAGDVEMLALCARCVDLSFGLRDVLVAIGCPSDLVAHHLHEDDVVGTISRGQVTAAPHTLEHLNPLMEMNEDEQTDFNGDEARKVVMDRKDYGFRSDVSVAPISSQAIAQYYHERSNALVQMQPSSGQDDIASRAKAWCLGHLADRYRNAAKVPWSKQNSMS